MILTLIYNLGTFYKKAENFTDKDIEERIIPELEVSADIELSECKIINSINTVRVYSL